MNTKINPTLILQNKTYKNKKVCCLFVCFLGGFYSNSIKANVSVSLRADQLHPPHLLCPAEGSFNFIDIWEFHTCLKNPFTHLQTCTCLYSKYSMISKYFSRSYIKLKAIDTKCIICIHTPQTNITKQVFLNQKSIG